MRCAAFGAPLESFEPELVAFEAKLGPFEPQLIAFDPLLAPSDNVQSTVDAQDAGTERNDALNQRLWYEPNFPRNLRTWLGTSEPQRRCGWGGLSNGARLGQPSRLGNP